MPEPTAAIKQIMEKIFDEAAVSYDSVGPSIFARFGERLVEHVPLAPGARGWILLQAKAQCSCQQRAA